MSSTEFLLGNEAVALGAIAAGVKVATGYPGTPSTEVLETLAKKAEEYGLYAEFSVNEKVALETAVGAAYAGQKAIVTMKQVGLNVASDPLLSLSYIGVKGALVLVVADDPGPHSSQTEQDTRVFGSFANVAVFDPATPQEAYDFTKEAFKLSAANEVPVILRLTTRVSHACADIIIDDLKPVATPIEGFAKDPRWVIFPQLTRVRHPWLEEKQKEMASLFATMDINRISGTGKIGIITSGVASTYAEEALSGLKEHFKIFKVATPYPFPSKKALSFLEGLEAVVAVEELDPYLENEIIKVIGRSNLKIRAYGKENGFFPYGGEYTVEVVKEGLNRVLKELNLDLQLSFPLAFITSKELPVLPFRPPNLCAGCMHRAVFYAFKKTFAAKKAFFCGDIGCYTLGNAPPLDTVDTCLCMSAGISIAAGLKRAEADAVTVAFIGDSTFFHSGIPAVVNAVYNQAPVIIAVLDNRTTAMTGHQPHPGLGITAMGKKTKALDIAAICKSCGVDSVEEVDARNFKASLAAIDRAKEVKGTAVIVFKGRCTNLEPYEGQYFINEDECISCNDCLEEIGCPALFLEDYPRIGENCTGCGLCAQICPADAIKVKGVER